MTEPTNTLQRQLDAEARDRAAVERLIRETGRDGVRRLRSSDRTRDFREVLLMPDLGAWWNFTHTAHCGPRRFATIDHSLTRVKCACGGVATVRTGKIWRCQPRCDSAERFLRFVAEVQAKKHEPVAVAPTPPPTPRPWQVKAVKAEIVAHQCPECGASCWCEPEASGGLALCCHCEDVEL